MGRSCVVVASFALLIAGCSKPETAVTPEAVVKPEAAFVGKWAIDAKNTNMTPESAKAAASIVLEIKADKTFAITTPNGVKSGTIDVSEKTATMTMADPKTDDDKKPVTGTLSEDGKSLKLTSTASADAVLYFVKA